MMKIAFTSPTPVPDEPQRIVMLLDEGWDMVHLRHPQSPRDVFEGILASLPHDKIRHIVLHDYFDLTTRFPTGAVQLNSRNPVPPVGYKGDTTASCHSVEEILRADGLKYVTLSPIFDSISKLGYTGKFSPAELQEIHRASVPVIALGGVTPLNAGLLGEYGFAGYAVMGALPWHDNINRFKTVLKCFSS